MLEEDDWAGQLQLFTKEDQGSMANVNMDIVLKSRHKEVFLELELLR